MFIVGSLFGWYARDADGEWVRRFRNAYVETGKGSGKTPIAAGIGLYGMVGDDEGAAEIYSAAKVRDQANILWTDARRMVEKIARPRQPDRGRRARPLDALAQRLVPGGQLRGQEPPRQAPHVVLIDEEHAHPDGEVIDAMRAGTKGRRNALIVRITNAGFDRHQRLLGRPRVQHTGPRGHPRRRRLVRLRGGARPVRRAPPRRRAGRRVPRAATSWTDEAVWLKANPNLGVSLPVRYLREMVTEALGKPSAAASVKRLCFCIWTEGSGKWLDPAAFAALADVAGPAPLPEGRLAYGGLDLASTADLTAFVLVAPREDCPIAGHASRCYDLRAWFWLPEANLADRVRRDRVPYDLWTDEGWITLTPGNRVDQERILADVIGAALCPLDRDRPLEHGLADARLQAEGFEVLEVGQGYASLSAPAKRLEADIASGLVHHDGNPVLRWMVANAAVSEDAAGNIKPDRERSADKIDGVAAWCDALFAWAGAPEPTLWTAE